MPEANAAVAIYPSHAAAEKAIMELQQSGFDLNKLSIVDEGYHTEENVIGYYTAVGAGLYSIGIPKDRLLQYETALKANKFVLLANGSAEDITQARSILQTTQPEKLDVHSSKAL